MLIVVPLQYGPGVNVLTLGLQYEPDTTEQPAGDDDNFGPIGRGSIVHRITARRALQAREVRPVIGGAAMLEIAAPTAAAWRALVATPTRPGGLLLTRSLSEATLRANFCSNCGARLPH